MTEALKTAEKTANLADLEKKSGVLRNEFVCVVCPNGCTIDAEFEPGTRETPPRLISFEGAKCARGEAWIRQEIESPMRTIATNVLVRGGDCINASVRTSRPIPLHAVLDVMAALRDVVLDAPVAIGRVVLKNPAGTDTDIIATRNVNKL